MLVFAKILIPVYTNLRQKGHLFIAFVNDLYLQGDAETRVFRECGSYYNSVKKIKLNYSFLSQHNELSFWIS